MKILLFFSGLFLLLSWLLPIHFLPWPSFYQEALAAFSLSLAALALAFSKEKLRAHPMFFFILLLAVIPVVQYAFGLVHYFGDAFSSTAFLLLLALAFLVGLNAKRVTEHNFGFDFLIGFSWVLVFGALLSLVVVLCQYLKIDNMLLIFALEEGARPYANLAQPNNLATLLGMGLASVLYLYETRSVSDALAKVMAFLLVFGLALVESRTSWVAAVFILGFWAWQSRKQTLRLSLKQVFYWVLLFAVLVFVIPVAAQWLFGKDNTLLAHATALHRWDMYKQFIYALQTGPWYGYGWAQVHQAQVAVTMDFPVDIATLYTHNVVLDLLIWNGPIIGGIIIFVIALWWFKLLKNADNLSAAYTWVALSFFILHAMLEFPHAYVFLLVPAAILLGALQDSETNSDKGVELHKNLFLIFALIAFSIVALFWRDYRAIEEAYLKLGKDVRENIETPKIINKENILILTQMQAYLRFFELPISSHYSEDQLDEMRALLWRFPRSFFLHKSAVVLTLNGHVDEAFHNMMLIAKLFGVSRLENSLGDLYEASAQEPRLAPLLERFGLTVKAAPSAPEGTHTENTSNP